MKIPKFKKKKRKCGVCKQEYLPEAGHQKFCSRQCRGKNFRTLKKNGEENE